MTLHKSGGIWFWRIGRIGGSFYLAKPRKRPDGRDFKVLAEIAGAAILGIPLGLAFAMFIIG
jgi:hypothetical protein